MYKVRKMIFRTKYTFNITLNLGNKYVKIQNLQ